MSRITTPEDLVRNTAYSVEIYTHRVQHAQDQAAIRKAMRSLRQKVDELERRAYEALAARPTDAEAGA